MGMDPADDHNGANPRSQYAGSREEATEELEVEIDASDDVELLQTAPAPNCHSPKWSKKSIEISTFHTGIGASFASWVEAPASSTDAADPRGSRRMASITSTSRRVV